VIFINNILTEELCIKLQKKYERNILISDIRAPEGEFVVSTDIYKDQELNNSFLKILKPLYSFLKFRMPFIDDYININIPYPNKIYLQAFSKSFSTETRLLVKDANKFKSSNYNQAKKYEERLAYYSFNIKRFKVSNKEYTNILQEWHCKCYDCILMFNIFKKFKTIHKLDKTILEIINFFMLQFK
jgi:hypothetical protein